MSKLICMGECLIDFIPSNEELSFIGKAGGAPANVCACVGTLGADAYYLGEMSNDNFGKYLLNKLKKCHVKTDYIKTTSTCGTGLAFVTLDENNDRSFTFYRDPCADMLLDPKNVKKDFFEPGDVLHFCSVDLVDCPTKDAHKQAIKYANENGAIVSFDVNLRLNIWNDGIKCLLTVKEFLPYCDIIKVTDEELKLITRESNISNGVKKLFEISKQAKLIFVTMGEKGSISFDRCNSISMPAKRVDAVDTTGAGDCFSGVIIYNLLNRKDKNKSTLLIDEMQNAIIMATKASSIVVCRKGAMESMPTLKEIEGVEL